MKKPVYSKINLPRAALRIASACLFLFFTQACATSQKYVPLTEQQTQYSLGDHEVSLLREADAIYLELKRRGFIYEDTEISSYVRELGNELAPNIDKSHIELEFFVLRDPTPNAMALPNGDIYINIGLISLCENEAQLASVLAHEISHIIHRHGIRSKIKGNRSVLAANITDIFLLGTKLSYITASMGLADYSREQEEEADREATGLLVKAGYDPAEAIRTLKLLSEVAPVDSTVGLYRSHPEDEKRMALLLEYIRENFKGLEFEPLDSQNEFGSMRPRIVEDGVQLRIAFRQYQLALNDLTRAETYYERAPLIDYYRGEVYRGIGDHPFDAAQDQAWMSTGKKAKDELVDEFKNAADKNYIEALAYYEKALAANPDLLIVYRGVGYIAYAQGRYEEALTSFTLYLTSEEKLNDRLYVERVLRELTEESN